MRNHKPIPFNQFNGLWAFGGRQSVPLDHFSDCLNVDYSQTSVRSRDGFTSLDVIESVRRSYVYKITGQTDRRLILDNAGSIWDSTNLTVPILTIAGMTDFGFENINGRAYLTPSNGKTGLPGESIYVYDGSGTARKAAGSAPSGAGFTVADSANAGNVEKGFHLFAVAFLTSSGFITGLGPEIFASYTATGGFSAALTNIPIDPTGIAVARMIVATRVIPNYNGNQVGYQFFFVPDGTINDNVTTSLDVSFFDQDLISDASYLLDLFDEIPAGVGLAFFNNRMISWGEDANPSVIRVSAIGQPEAVDQVTGLISIDPSDNSHAIGDCQAYQGSLYASKPSRFYIISDNGGDPVTWQWKTIDSGIGAYNNGIIPVLDNDGVTVNRLFVVDQSGLIVFDGAFERPEMSWKVKDLWKRINKKYAYKISAVHNPKNQHIYIAVPLDDATEPSHVLMADYSCADPFFWDFYKNIKWAIWQFPEGNSPTSLAIYEDADAVDHLYVGMLEGNTYEQQTGTHDDWGNAIPTPMFESAAAGLPDNSIVHVIAANILASGNGTLIPTFFDINKARSDIGVGLTLNATPDAYLRALTNLTSFKISVKCQVNNIGEYFEVNSLFMYLKPIWTEYPG